MVGTKGAAASPIPHRLSTKLTAAISILQRGEGKNCAIESCNESTAVGLMTPMIVGVCIGFVVLVGVVWWCCCCCRRRNREEKARMEAIRQDQERRRMEREAGSVRGVTGGAVEEVVEVTGLEKGGGGDVPPPSYEEARKAAVASLRSVDLTSEPDRNRVDYRV
jgi:hypothetical protein